MKQRVIIITWDDVADQVLIHTPKVWSSLTKSAKKDILEDVISELINMEDQIEVKT